MDKREKGELDEEAVLSILTMIESYVVRRTVCGIPTNRLRRFFARMSKQVLETNNLVDGTREYLDKNDWPSDDAFRESSLMCWFNVNWKAGRFELAG